MIFSEGRFLFCVLCKLQPAALLPPGLVTCSAALSPVRGAGQPTPNHMTFICFSSMENQPVKTVAATHCLSFLGDLVGTLEMESAFAPSFDERWHGIHGLSTQRCGHLST